MFLDDMVTLLVTGNVGVAGRTIFMGSGATLPAIGSTDTPFLTLIETGGTSPWIMHQSDTTPAYQRPSMQVVARSTSWAAARLLAKNAYNVFVQRRSLTINNTWYLSVDVRQEPFDLGPDESGSRVRVAFNVDAVKRPS